MIEIKKLKDIVVNKAFRAGVCSKSKIDALKAQGKNGDFFKVEEIYMTNDGKVVFVVPDTFVVKKEQE